MIDLLIFSGLSMAILVSSILVITTEDVFKSALLLALMFLGVAGIFITLEAEFLAAVQILVYVGAVILLMIFGIMLTEKENTRGDA
jgi:NADH:ubiquinone oxidoreductase subunit 6 (subunit J)